jgi:predicted DNA-binding transcriptional regulator YafY
VAELQRAIAQRRAILLVYQGAEEQTPNRRVVRPLLLEGHGSHWYLHAFCTLRQAERLFRVDRIQEMRVLERLPQHRGGLDRRKRAMRIASRRSALRTRTGRQSGVGFFAPPPAPPPGSPLVRIWLVEDT